MPPDGIFPAIWLLGVRIDRCTFCVCNKDSNFDLLQLLTANVETTLFVRRKYKTQAGLNFADLSYFTILFGCNFMNIKV